jgi:hypothetical protein
MLAQVRRLYNITEDDVVTVTRTLRFSRECATHREVFELTEKLIREHSLFVRVNVGSLSVDTVQNDPRMPVLQRWMQSFDLCAFVLGYLVPELLRPIEVIHEHRYDDYLSRQSHTYINWSSTEFLSIDGKNLPLEIISLEKQKMMKDQDLALGQVFSGFSRSTYLRLSIFSL